MCNIALHWTAHITTVQCNNLFIHSDLVSLAVCTLTVATCMHPYTSKFPFLHIIGQYIFCKYIHLVNNSEGRLFMTYLGNLTEVHITVIFYYSGDVLQTRSKTRAPFFSLCFFFFLVLDRVDNVFAALTIHYMVGCKKTLSTV